MASVVGNHGNECDARATRRQRDGAGVSQTGGDIADCLLELRCALRRTFNGLVCDFAALSCADASEDDIRRNLHETWCYDSVDVNTVPLDQPESAPSL